MVSDSAHRRFPAGPGVALCLVVLTGAGCVEQRARPGSGEASFVDPLYGRHSPSADTVLPNNALLREFFQRAHIAVLDHESAVQVPDVIRQARKCRAPLILARDIRAHDLSLEAAAMLRQWVFEGGVLWLRSNSSLETYFGVRWKPRERYYTLNRMLVRDDGEIVQHPLTRGVRRLWITGLGVYEPVSDEAVHGWEDVLVGPSGCMFGVLHYGKGMIIFDSSDVDPEKRNPYIGIYGFDADVFWMNFLAYVGMIKSPPEPPMRDRDEGKTGAPAAAASGAAGAAAGR